MFLPTRAEAHGAQTVFGAAVVVRDFVRAAVTHGHPRAWHFLRMAETEGLLSTSLVQTAARRSDGTRVHLHALDALLRGVSKLRVDVWHDVDADVQRPFAFRRWAGGRWPITLTHHSLSYQVQRHAWLLPLLTADVRAEDAILCTSNDARTALRRLLDDVALRFGESTGVKLAFRGRLEVVPLGVDTELFRPRNRADVRHQLGLPTDAFTLLWVGRFGARDKADLLPLLKVFRNLLRLRPGRSLMLVLAGTDRDRDSAILRDFAQALGIAANVRIIRDLDPSRRHLMHNVADVFVSPVDNVQETFGLTPVEAMASGVPQVVSDWDGYRDTVADGETGFRIPTLWADCGRRVDAVAPITGGSMLEHLGHAQSVVVDLQAFQDKLLLLLDRPTLAQQLGAASRRRAVRQLGWKSVLQQYERIWADVARTPAAPLPGSSRAMAWAQPSTFEAFSHYATALLEDGQRLEVTEDGRAALSGREPFPSYQAEAELDVDRLSALLEALRRPKTVAALCARNGDLEDTRRLVLWLLKYGFVRRAA